MTRPALMCSLILLTGCAVHYTPHQAINNWAAVQWLPSGTEVAVRVDGAKHTGAVESVSKDGLVVRRKTGTVSIGRPEVRRVSLREACRSRRKPNIITSSVVWTLGAVLLVPFHHGNDAALV